MSFPPNSKGILIKNIKPGHVLWNMETGDLCLVLSSENVSVDDENVIDYQTNNWQPPYIALIKLLVNGQITIVKMSSIYGTYDHGYLLILD